MNNPSISTCIIEKFDTSELNIRTPIFYNNPKNETKLAYLLLSYMYFNTFNEFLCTDNIGKTIANKPFFINKDIFFNISHSRDFVSCVLSTIPVGIDIEQERALKKATLSKFICISDTLSPLTVWCIKEAYSKYLGVGMAIDFAKTSINSIEEVCTISHCNLSINKKKLFFSLCHNKFYASLNKINIISNNDILDFYHNKI